MYFKKTVAFFTSVSILLTLAACGNKDTVKKETQSKNNSSNPATSSSSPEVTDDEAANDTDSSKASAYTTDKYNSSANDSSQIDFDSLLNAASKNSGYSLDEVQNGQYAIVSGDSARVTSAKITNANAKNMGKLPVETVELYAFNDEWAFNHAAFITSFNGKLYAFWGQGKANEDDLGQRIVATSSSDFYHWDKVKVVSDSRRGILNPDADAVQMVSGFFNNGKSLSLIYSVSEYRKESLRNNGTLRPLVYDFVTSSSYQRTLQADGTWGAETAGKGGGNLTAFQLKSGRWVVPSGAGIKYSDDDGKSWYSSGASAAQVENAKIRGAKDICEPGCYETADGVLHVLLRSDAQYLWQTQSTDNGKTWSDIYPTHFSNDSSKFQTGRLSDGRYYIIGNTVYGGNRCPLSISLSDDGYNFNREYIICDENIPLIKEGLAKGGVYGYPTCCIQGDYMYVIYSVNKEIIRATRFLLSCLK